MHNSVPYTVSIVSIDFVAKRLHYFRLSSVKLKHEHWTQFDVCVPCSIRLSIHCHNSHEIIHVFIFIRRDNSNLFYCVYVRESKMQVCACVSCFSMFRPFAFIGKDVRLSIFPFVLVDFSIDIDSLSRSKSFSLGLPRKLS